jgi:phospholipase C
VRVHRPGRETDVTLTRRQLLQGLGIGVGLAAVGGTAPWAGPLLSRAGGIVPGPGTRPFPSLPEGTDTMPLVEHIVIYMQENHSFDNYFGVLGRGDGLTLGPGGVPLNTNPDLHGNPVAMFHEPSGCDTIPGASQSWDDSHISWDDGAMDGFVRAAGGGIGSMGYWDGTDLPFYYGLASTFPLCDRWFCSVLAQTFPNRRYLQAATSVGIVSTSVSEVLATPDAPNGVIWDRLNDHGITWNDYAFDLADIDLFPNFAAANGSHVKTYTDFLIDCANGTLPAVSIISPGNTTYTEEGPADVRNGEAYSSAIVNAVLHGPGWPKTVMFFTYDEHGGYYDHVPPPPAAAPDSIPPRITVPPDQPGAFDRYGMRVPGFVISPFAKRNYVSHVVHDHTSILKFIETKYNLGAMTFRDANADDLLDTLDFAFPGFVEPPELPTPALPNGGSTCQPLKPPATQPPPGSVTTTTTAPTTSTTSTSVPSSTSAPSSTSSPSSAAVRAASGSPSSSAPAVAAQPTFTG